MKCLNNPPQKKPETFVLRQATGQLLGRIKPLSAQVVYVTRNPKDMAISLFNNFKMFKVFEFESEKEEYFKDIMNNKS